MNTSVTKVIVFKMDTANSY